jgi:hypothetical protein
MKIVTIDTGLQKIELSVTKIVEIKTKNKQFIYFDRHENGDITLSYTSGMFKEVDVLDEEPKVKPNYVREGIWP